MDRERKRKGKGNREALFRDIQLMAMRKGTAKV